MRKSGFIWAGVFFICIVLQVNAVEIQRKVAITIDDLPRSGDSTERSLSAIRAMTKQLLRPFHDEGIPVTGFVNEGRKVDFGPEGIREILELWLDAGAELGNHTYSHININSVSLEEFKTDVIRGEPILKAALAARGRRLRYFRHPFLFTGPTPEKKTGMQDFLDERGYQVVPVTFDNADYMYAALYTRSGYRERVRKEYVPYMESIVTFFENRSIEVVGREFPQILLIHANQLNADLIPELLAMFRRRGYEFVSVNEALSDETYRLAENYVGRGGFSWIHRWAMTKGMEPKGEPAPPAWVRDAYSLQ